MLAPIALVIFSVVTISISQWIESTTSTLPLEDCDIAVGTYNKSIYLLGGDYNHTQLTEYLISEDTFIDHPTQWGSDVYGYAQYWTQIGHILYIKDHHNDAISIFDMKTKTFTSNYITNVPNGLLPNLCVASTQTQIFAVGGSTGDSTKSPFSRDVSIYDLLTSKWLSNIPPMQSARTEHACIVHPTTNALYALAGFETKSSLISSIETIEISDIQHKSWTYIEPLSHAMAWIRCVVHTHTIYVIGGNADNKATNEVHTINVLTNQVTVSPDKMPRALTDVAPIVVDDTIYVFGGYTHGAPIEKGVNTWMAYDLYTPTSFPSESPTSQSDAPTSAPTTLQPTTHPSSYPTHDPTTPPTAAPTSPPTNSDANAVIIAMPPSKPPTYAMNDTVSLLVTHTQMVSTQSIQPVHASNPTETKSVGVLVAVISSLCILIVGCLYVKYRAKKVKTTENINVEIASTNIVKCDVDAPVPCDIMQWLTEIVKLPQYYDNFIENGYDDLEFLKDISEKSELQEIGVRKVGHQVRLLAKIVLLKQQWMQSDDSDHEMDQVIDVSNSEGSDNQGAERIPPLQITAMCSVESNISMAVRKQLETDIGDQTDGFVIEEISDGE